MPPIAVLVCGLLVLASLWIGLYVWASDGAPPGRVVCISIGGCVLGSVGGLVTATGIQKSGPTWLMWLGGPGELALYAHLPFAGATLGLIVAGIVGRAYNRPRPDDQES